MRTHCVYKTCISIIALILLSTPAFASCLNSTQVETINQLANTTNTSNTSLINLFEYLCNYQDANISSLQNSSELLNNRTAEINNSLLSVNSTLYEELEKLEARMNYYFLDNVSTIINETYKQESLNLYNNFTSDTDNVLQNFTVKFQSMLESQIDSIWEKMATKDDINATKDLLRTEIASINKQNELSFGQNIFWGGVIFLVAVGALVYFKYYKVSYPKVTARFMPRPERKLPHMLDDEEELSLKDKIRKMRDFILKQTQFEGTTRATAYKKFLDGELETEDDVMKEMEMLEIDKQKVIRHDKKKKVIKHVKKK